MKQKVDLWNLPVKITSTTLFLHQMLTVYWHTNKTTNVILFCRVIVEILQKFLSTYEALPEGKTVLAFFAQKKNPSNFTSKGTTNSLGSQNPKQIILFYNSIIIDMWYKNHRETCCNISLQIISMNTYRSHH